MNQQHFGHDESGQDDDMKSEDIERELYSSAREASVGFVAFADLDFSKAALGRIRVDNAEPEKGRGARNGHRKRQQS